MRKLIAAFVGVMALAFAGTALGGSWHWGYNYLGNSTNNGLCSGVVAEPGAVCSGWDYWYSNYLDKRGGGTICFGWGNNNSSSCYAESGAVVAATRPTDLGMGGYLKSIAYYEYNAASYLYTSATT
jgi:hypothetical protein